MRMTLQEIDVVSDATTDFNLYPTYHYINTIFIRCIYACVVAGNVLLCGAILDMSKPISMPGGQG